MFRIKQISLNNGKDSVDFFNDSTFVWADNNKGKTLLFHIIDYMLGTESNAIWSMKGMDNVSSLEAIISSDEAMLYLKRTAEGKMFYKNDEMGVYQLTDRAEYISKIETFLPNSPEFNAEYLGAVGENPTFRGLSYLNFINQDSFGYINPAIPEIKDIQWVTRIKNQMLFVFNKDQQIELNRLLNEKKKCEDNILKGKRDKVALDYYLGLLRDSFINLSLPFSDNLEVNKQTFEAYLKNDFKSFERKKTDHSDLIYLLKVKEQLESRISIEKEFKAKKELFSTAKNRVDYLMQSLQSLLGDDERFKDYLRDTNAILEKNSYKKELLDIKDYDKTIRDLQAQKKLVDEKLDVIQQNLSEKSFMDINQSVNTIQLCINYLSEVRAVEDISANENKIKELNKQISAIKLRIKNAESSSFNAVLTQLYLSCADDFSFIKEDSEESGFMVAFIPRSCFCEGRTAATKDGETVVYRYIPGSKARRSFIKAILYICLYEIIMKTYPFMHLIPLLVIDGFNEPFQTSYCQKAFESLSRICREKGIQLIVTSHFKIQSDYLISINNGLNSLHNAAKESCVEAEGASLCR